jgi:ERCC4-type nuclease
MRKLQVDGVTLNKENGQAGLPALRGLAALATCRPIIVIDSREQEPLAFSHLEFVTSSLYSGDYSVAGLEHLFTVERKSIEDIVACCMGPNRSRFERELCRLRGYRFKRLLIIGCREDITTGRLTRGFKSVPPSHVLVPPCKSREAFSGVKRDLMDILIL